MGVSLKSILSGVTLKILEYTYHHQVVPALLVHYGGEEPQAPLGHCLLDCVRVAALPAHHHIAGHARHHHEVALKLVPQKLEVLARCQHDLLGHVLIPVRARALHLAPDEHVPLEPVGSVEGRLQNMGLPMLDASWKSRR